MANIIEMSDTKMTLAQNPMIGFIATIIGFITPFITAIVPIVQLLVAIVGLIISLLTVEAKWKERQLNKKKKINALDMGFPKLKAECIKNAANSLGKLFGRDLNRKKSDIYQPLIKDRSPEAVNQLTESLKTIKKQSDV